MKLQMAKFLQDTIEEMAVSSKRPKKDDTVREFATFFEKVQVYSEYVPHQCTVLYTVLYNYCNSLYLFCIS